MRAGAPGRGASANRSSIPLSLRARPCPATQRSRHRRTVSTLTDNSCAIFTLLCPPPAASTICARKTSCCPLLCRLVSCTNAVCSSSLNTTRVARFGISFPLAFSPILSHTDFCPCVLGNYRLLHYLGGGGFADVYLGEHVHLGRQAAIKILKLQHDQDAYNNFLIEARRAAALQHPHIISVLEFDIERNIPFLVMDYAPHGTLRDRHPHSSRVPLPIVVNYVQQIASALHYAHQQRLIHRDIKPANMLVSINGEILLSDFGISIIAHRTETMTPQAISGTYTYTAPEQLQGKARPESDQYSLAIAIYEWLCGTPPFTGALHEIALQHQYSSPSPLRQHLPDLPSAVDAAMLKALAKEPQQRFPTILDFANAISEAAEARSRLRLHGDASPSVQTELAAPFSPGVPQTRGISPAPGTRQFSQEFSFIQPIATPPTPNEDADRSRASLSHRVNTSSQSMASFSNRFFSVPQEKIQLALVVEKRAAWEVEVRKRSTLVDVEECYLQGLRDRSQRNIEGAVLWWLQGIALNPGYNHGIFIKIVKEDFLKLLPQHLTILRNRLKQVRQGSDLEQEIKLLEDMQTLDPQSQDISEQLIRARQDKEHFWMCELVYQLLTDDEILLAAEQLRMLQSYAPTFRNLPALRERIIPSINDRVRRAMDNGDLSQAQQYLVDLQQIAPQDSRLHALQ